MAKSRLRILCIIVLLFITVTGCGVDENVERVEPIKTPLLWSFTPSSAHASAGVLKLKTEAEPFQTIDDNVLRSSLKFSQDTSRILYLNEDYELFYWDAAQDLLLVDKNIAWLEYQLSAGHPSVCYLNNAHELYKLNPAPLQGLETVLIAEQVRNFQCAESNSRVYFLNENYELNVADHTIVQPIAKAVDHYTVSSSGHVAAYSSRDNGLSLWSSIGGSLTIWEEQASQFYFSDTGQYLWFHETSAELGESELYVTPVSSGLEPKPRRVEQGVIRSEALSNDDGMYILTKEQELKFYDLRTNKLELISTAVKDFKLLSNQGVIYHTLTGALFAVKGKGQSAEIITEAAERFALLPSQEVIWVALDGKVHIRDSEGEIEEALSLSSFQEIADQEGWFLKTKTNEMSVILSSQQTYKLAIPEDVTELYTRSQTVYRRGIDVQDFTGSWSNIEDGSAMDILKTNESLGTLVLHDEEDTDRIGFEVIYSDPDEMHILIKDKPNHLIKLQLTGDFLWIQDGDILSGWLRAYP
jgi:hypothetical protein